MKIDESTTEDEKVDDLGAKVVRDLVIGRQNLFVDETEMTSASSLGSVLGGARARGSFSPSSTSSPTS